MDAETQPAKPFGALLLDLGKVDEPTLERALAQQAASGDRLGDILTRQGTLSDVDKAEALSIHLGLPLTTADEFPAEPVLADTISANFLKELKIIPLADSPDGLAIAMADPLDAYVVRALELVAHKPVMVRVAAERDIEAAYERLYASGQTALDALFADISAEGPDVVPDQDVERLKDLASEAPVIRLVNLLINRALEERASDIHIEPFDNELKVRYRIDGLLREKKAPPARMTAAITSRIKIMAKLNIAERRLAQDGRIRFHFRGREIDIRVSTVPTVFGESIVMRLLDKTGLVLDFPSLGYASDDEAHLRKALSFSNGILIVTGPTGSGKSTSLYAALNLLNTPDKKIITAEDPVEYQLRGINQIQVKPQIGLTFARILRSVVRQDPDIIMIGEMRDLETAQIAVQSALTGHLVLSTLHTNNAAGAVTRLLDMGVEDYLMTSTLRAVVGQRLVRTLCPACRQPYAPAAELVDKLSLDRFAGSGNVTLYHPRGCAECDGIGYIGRSGLFEILLIDDTIRRLIVEHADTNALHAAAVADGMRTMYEDGLTKSCTGVTTLEEVLRVTQSV